MGDETELNLDQSHLVPDILKDLLTPRKSCAISSALLWVSVHLETSFVLVNIVQPVFFGQVRSAALHSLTKHKTKETKKQPTNIAQKCIFQIYAPKWREMT